MWSKNRVGVHFLFLVKKGLEGTVSQLRVANNVFIIRTTASEAKTSPSLKPEALAFPVGWLHAIPHLYIGPQWPLQCHHTDRKQKMCTCDLLTRVF